MTKTAIEKAFFELCKKEKFTVLDVDKITVPENCSWKQREDSYRLNIRLVNRAIETGKIKRSNGVFLRCTP